MEESPLRSDRWRSSSEVPNLFHATDGTMSENIDHQGLLLHIFCNMHKCKDAREFTTSKQVKRETEKKSSSRPLGYLCILCILCVMLETQYIFYFKMIG